MVRIVLQNGKEVTIEHQVFRRILVTALSSLSRLKEMEGSDFPKVDRDASKAITNMQFIDRDLI